MMTALRLARLRAVVTSLYVAAMLSFGFAHAPPPSSRADPALAWLAASLPQGALVALCSGAADPADEARHANHVQDCAACQLAAAPGLAPAPDAAFRLPLSLAVVNRIVEPPPPASREAVRPNSRGRR